MPWRSLQTNPEVPKSSPANVLNFPELLILKNISDKSDLHERLDIMYCQSVISIYSTPAKAQTT